MRSISLESMSKLSMASSSQCTRVFLCSYLLLMEFFNCCRFPSSVKALLKPGKSDATPAKGSLTSGKPNVIPINTPQPQTEVDLV